MNTKRTTPHSDSQLQSFERRAGVDSDNVDIVGGTQSVDLSAAARGGIALPDARGIEIDRERVVSVSDEAFMAERVEIHMHDAPDENEPQFAEVTVNGRYELIVRGQTKVLPRCHVAALANAKQLRVQQKKIVAPDGSMGYEEKAVLRLAYPFSVTNDPNPRGAAWLRQMMQSPA